VFRGCLVGNPQRATDLQLNWSCPDRVSAKYVLGKPEGFSFDASFERFLKAATILALIALLALLFVADKRDPAAHGAARR